MRTYQLSINTATITRLLATVIALLLCASMIGQVIRFEPGYEHVHGLVRLFDVDGERNIPTFFTVLLALGNALLLVLIAAGVRPGERPLRRYWLALAAGFLLLAYDEGFQVHERLTQPMRELLGKTDLGYLYFGWVVPGIAGVLVLSLCFVNFFRQLPATTRWRILLAGGLYLGGCIGMELVDGKYMEAHGDTLAYGFLTTIEEGLEMSGLAILTQALLAHVVDTYDRIELRFSAKRPVAAMPVIQ